TGTTTWSRGTGTQVDLAACLDDKTTCNAQDAAEASWNSGWLSSNRYASTVQTTTAPGALGTFSYNITAPANVTAGTYRFNGDLVLSSTGEKIHPEGYFQDATVGGGGTGATITSLTLNNGSTSGGNNVVIAGTGFVCTPAFPSVSFGGTNAAVSSCGNTSVTAVAPAHAAGAVIATLTNSGAAASNGLTYTYADTTAPTFTGISVAGSFITVTFSEPVCRAIGPTGVWAAGDWTINNISSGLTDIPDSGDSIPTCNAAADNGVTSAIVDVSPATITPGAFVEVTLNTRGAATTASDNEAIQDKAGNRALAPQARQATAQTPETTPPTLVSASGNVGSPTITLTFSEPVYCSAAAGWVFAAEDIVVDDTSSTTDPSVTGAGSNACGTTPTTADTSFSFTISPSLKADTTYTVTLSPEANEIQDVFGNDLANPSSVTFVSGAADLTAPTIVDARVAANGGTSDFTEAGDAFNLTFSETMTDTDEVGTITIQDQDGTVLTLDCATAAVTCAWNTAKTTVTVTLVTNTASPVAPAAGAGTTPGMQIPFNVTTLTGTSFTDTQGNAVNVLGSSDRLVDYE
ncbi:MAG: Ig-like domain-containing protein, partial [Chloroflexota bacterium]|nr:Ig-like domain-containing protein [Chloroflexota bacterium]